MQALLTPKINEAPHIPRTAEERTNETIIRQLYTSADAATKDTQTYVSLFSDDGYFYDVAGGKKYYGNDLRLTVDAYVAAFPDMHRELYQMYFMDDVVVIELSLNGTNTGDLVTQDGRVSATRKECTLQRRRTDYVAATGRVRYRRDPQEGLMYE